VEPERERPTCQLQDGAIAAEQPTGSMGQGEVDELLIVRVGATHPRGGTGWGCRFDDDSEPMRRRANACDVR